jgi:hypothetical protein
LTNKDKPDICTECGYCCDGTMFSQVKLTNDVENGLDTDGNTVYNESLKDYIHTSFDKKQKKSCLVFKQPCPMLKDKKCTIYTDRPFTCQQFKCKLLKNYNDGNKTYDEAMEIIKKPKAREFLNLEEYKRYVKNGRLFFKKIKNNVQ